MDEARRRAYLQAMGIEQFRLRSPMAETAEPPVADEPLPAVGSPPARVEARPAEAGGARAESAGPPAVRPAEDHPDLPPLDAYDFERESSLLETGFDEPGFESPTPAAPDLSNLDWDGLRARVAACRACSLCESRTQTVFGVGSQTAELLIIGEAPGADEDRQGEPFVGRAGQLLNAMLQAIGLSREQVYIANILKCRPPGNRNPGADEARACRGYLDRQIALLEPKLILSLGGVSAHNLLDTDESVGRLRRGQHRLGENGLPLLVSYHPAYLLRRPEEKAKSWDDLQRVAQLLSRL